MGRKYEDMLNQYNYRFNKKLEKNLKKYSIGEHKFSSSFKRFCYINSCYENGICPICESKVENIFPIGFWDQIKFFFKCRHVEQLCMEHGIVNHDRHIHSYVD